MAQINISNTLWNDTSGGVLAYAKQVQDNEVDYSKYSRITSEIINRFHLNTKFQTRLNDFFLNLYDEFCTGMDTVPNDTTRSQTDATFVHKENGTITDLFYLRQATSQLAGLLSAADKQKLDDLPSAQETNAGITYDVSVIHPTSGVNGGSTYASLSAALAVIPQDKRRGGMTVKFVLNSDNKYVQYSLTAQTFSTTESDWQGVDSEPTVGSQNLVTSGGVSSLGDNISKNVDENSLYIGAKNSYTFTAKNFSGLRYNGSEIVAVVDGGTSDSYIIPCTSGIRYTYTSDGTIYSLIYCKNYPVVGGSLVDLNNTGTITPTDDGYLLFTVTKTSNLSLVLSSTAELKYKTELMFCRSNVFGENITFGLSKNNPNGYANIVKQCIKGIYTTDSSLFNKKLILRVFGISGSNFLWYVNDSSSVADNVTPDLTSTNVDTLTVAVSSLGTGIKKFIGENQKIIIYVDVDLLASAGYLAFYTCYNNAAITLSGFESSQEIERIDNAIEDITEEISEIKEYDGIELNGTDAWFELKEDIVLQSNGDSLEIGVWCDEIGNISANHGYAFAYNDNSSNKIGLGLTTTSFALKTDNSSGFWPILVTSMKPYGEPNTFLPLFNNMVIKVVYEDNKIKFYRNGILIDVYNGTGKMTLSSFGKAYTTSYGYWKGIINYIKVNNVNLDLISDTVLHNAVLHKKETYPIKIDATDTNYFNVYVLNQATGKYVIHTFKKYYGTNTIGSSQYVTQDVWTADEILNPNGDHIYQGNLNFIYKVGKVNGVSSSDVSVSEAYHVGPGHGCEVTKFAKFFADGMEFDPLNISSVITCSTFRFIMKSECYVVDSSVNTGNVNNCPKVDNGELLVNCIHYIDAVYNVDNRINIFNRLTQVRDDSIQYEMMAGAMLEGRLDYNSEIMLNDVDNSWNHVVDSGSDATYTEPTDYDSQIIRGETISADTIVMYGETCICHQSLSRKDNAMQDHVNIYTQSNRASDAKCYFNAVRTTNMENPDTLQEGDVVACYVNRQMEIK